MSQRILLEIEMPAALDQFKLPAGVNDRRPGFKGFEEATGYDVAAAFIGYVRDRVLTGQSA